MEKKSIDLVNLELDLSNPRINPAADQNQALVRIIRAESTGDEVGRKLISLAKSIADEGYEQSERLIVTPNPDDSNRYIVLDGNRRLAALRLLTTPNVTGRDDLTLSAVQLRRIRKLQEEFEKHPSLASVDVLVSPDRASAHKTIKRKHSGELDGAGRSGWEAFQERRFSNSGSYQMLMALRDANMLAHEALLQVNRGDFQISTFERVAQNEEFMSAFGAQVRAAKYVPDKPSDLALQAFSKVADDVAAGAITSRDRVENTEKIRVYLAEIKGELASKQSGRDENPDRDHSDTPDLGQSNSKAAEDPGPRTNKKESTSSEESSDHSKPEPKRQSPVKPRRPRSSPCLIKKADLFVTTHKKCNDLMEELTKVRVADAPYACSHVVRSLMEITASLYCQQFELTCKANNTENIQKVGVDLIGQSRMPSEPSDRSKLGQALKKDACMYSDLSEIAHNSAVHISEGHVRATWDSVWPALRLAWDRMIYAADGAGQR